MPQGGMSVQVTSIQTTEMMDVIYEAALFTPDAPDTTYPAGTILKRLTDGVVGPAAAIDSDLVGVLGTELTSDGSPSAENIEFIIGGEVDGETVSFSNGDPVTTLTWDKLRDYGIAPRRTKELSKRDNGAEGL